MTPWLALAISLAAVAVAVIVLRIMIDRRAGEARVMDEIRREIGAMLTEMNQTTERNIELVEDRLKELREALSQVDKRLAVLKRESERSESATITYSELRRHAQLPPEPDTSAAAVEARPGRDESPTAAPAAGMKDEADVEEEPPLRERVLRLYRQGISLERIASRVGTTVGEVELIVSLHER